MKYVLCWCCLCIITSTLYAQEDVLRPNGRTTSSVGSAADKTGDGSSSSNKGKTTFALGIEGGIGFNFFSQTLMAGTPQDQINTFSQGNGIGGFGAIVADIGFSDMIGIQPRIGYQVMNFSRKGTYKLDCPDQSGFGTDTVATIDYSDDNTGFEYYTFGLSIRVTPVKNFMVLLGPTFHFRNAGSTPTVSGTATIASPDHCWFYDQIPDGIRDSSKTSSFTQQIDNTNNFRAGLDISVAYKIDLNKSWALVPRAGFQYMFTKPAENQTQKDFLGNDITVASDRVLNTLQVGIGLWYYFN